MTATAIPNSGTSRILIQGMSSFAKNITDAVVIKDWNLFLLTDPSGQIPIEDGHGFGLYYHDCRYLNGYELKLGDMDANCLGSQSEEGFKAIFQLANPDLEQGDGRTLARETLGIRWERALQSRSNSLVEKMTIQNFGLDFVEIPIDLTFRSEFEDIMLIRKTSRDEVGLLTGPVWADDRLCFVYDGKDGMHRSLTIEFAETPDRKESSRAVYDLRLGPREKKEIGLTLSISESRERHSVDGRIPHVSPRLVDEEHERELEERPEVAFRVRTSSILFDRILSRSVRDLIMLQSRIGNHEYLAAGIPWFATLFGRDSLLASSFALGCAPENAIRTVRILAHYQGRKWNDFTEEAPGKILHELRMGELANLRRIVHIPYYGTVDATPLFVSLVARHFAWSGDLSLFEEVRPAVDLALDWIDRRGDSNGDGYVDYRSTSTSGLVNQGWKDSSDAIIHSDGSMAEAPIALCEVQGYVYAAKGEIADLFERVGEPTRAARLRDEAGDLKQRFNRDFWDDEKNLFVLALDKRGRKLDVVSSNPGHLLWTGIAEHEKAALTVERLLADDMFTGWGVRTLSKREARYNPMGYHVGSVWPHDNAICAAGFRRYGFDQAARKVAMGLFEAAYDFENSRLPELFAGFGKEDYSFPVRYPVACHPQAWAAATPLYLLSILLGFEPQGAQKRLVVRRPLLPDRLEFLELEGLNFAGAKIDLRFDREEDGVQLTTVSQRGDVEVVRE